MAISGNRITACRLNCKPRRWPRHGGSKSRGHKKAGIRKSRETPILELYRQVPSRIQAVITSIHNYSRTYRKESSVLPWSIRVGSDG